MFGHIHLLSSLYICWHNEWNRDELIVFAFPLLINYTLSTGICSDCLNEEIELRI